MILNQTAPRIRSPETWERVREAYVAGMSGPEACERFGISLSALRERASREGWRRADDACWPAPVWGQGEAQPYAAADLQAALAAGGAALGVGSRG